MRLRTIATAVIAVFIVLVEALWLSISVRYGFIADGEVLGYIPWLIVVFFIPFLVGIIIQWFLLSSLYKSFRHDNYHRLRSFKLKYFHRSVNWIALFITLVGLAIVVTKKVPVTKIDSFVKIIEKVEITESSVNEVKNIEVVPEVIIPNVFLEAKDVPLDSEKLFTEIKNGCFKSHSPDDGFNQVQMLDYCECVVEDAKSSLTLAEIKSITKSLSTTETSGEALLENDAMVGIVVECISKTSVKE